MQAGTRLHTLPLPSERPAQVVVFSPATRPATPDPAMGIPPPPLLWGRAYCRWQCRGRRRPHMPFVQRLRMGSLLPASWSTEYRGWLLVPHCRSLQICPNLGLIRPPAGRRCRTRGSSGRWSPGHAGRLGGLQLHLVMSWPGVPDIPRAPGRMEDLRGRRARSGLHRPKTRRYWPNPGPAPSA
jgi:hypothetical protein